ncbi:hypothetical protein Glove_180g72 [Diversispora epigaea]|uniref:Uncharacterized protein n=1 Tax=Diversispora epigaea TaxID=1348612 RepID=A0A397IN04_9GLOM|nr:hypothetical protein Glove_180g72 [Diversispora epigaea]
MAVSILLCLAGSWKCILGAENVEKSIIDLLNDFILLILTNDHAHIERMAQLFKALYLGINRLGNYYKSLQINIHNKMIQDKLLWRAIINDGQNIIKFTNNYKSKNT